MSFQPLTASRPPFLISTDKSLLDLDAILGFLQSCYWSPGIVRPRFERGIQNSLCFGLYDTDTPRPPSSATRGPASFLDSVDLSDPPPSQAGFARVISDLATFAYLADVFVLEPYRGHGLSKWLIQTILAHPDFQGLRRFCLMTRDAQGLYARYGFAPMPDPTRYMEILDKESYKRV